MQARLSCTGRGISLTRPRARMHACVQMSFEGIPVARPVRPEPKKVARGQPPPEEVPTKQ